jgi:hypothetical protein
MNGIFSKIKQGVKSRGLQINIQFLGLSYGPKGKCYLASLPETMKYSIPMAVHHQNRKINKTLKLFLPKKPVSKDSAVISCLETLFILAGKVCQTQK